MFHSFNKITLNKQPNTNDLFKFSLKLIHYIFAEIEEHYYQKYYSNNYLDNLHFLIFNENLIFISTESSDSGFTHF